MRTLYILAAIFTIFSFPACNIINPKESTPTYVHVDSFQFVPGSYATEGSASHNITCVWVYYNNAPVGVFDLPCTFPVITNGNSGHLTLVPGITVDGVTAYQAQYPFYYGDTSTLTTNPGHIINYLPKTGYNSGAKYVFKEDFESANNFLKITGDTGIVSVTDPSLVFEGHRSGYIDLKTANDSSENVFLTKVPFHTGQCYVEINYKNSTPFFVGIEGFDASGNPITSEPEYVVGINPSTTWKKVYVSLLTPSSKYIALFPGATFRLAIKSLVREDLSSGYVILDNVKYITD